MFLFLISLFTSQSGWLLVVLLIATITLPYLFRRGSVHLQDPTLPPILRRLQPHYWIGYAISAIGLVHAGLASVSGAVAQINIWGLMFAFVALLSIGIQILLGRRLSNPREPDRGRLRRLHFRFMMLLAVTSLGHIALNSPTLRILVGLGT